VGHRMIAGNRRRRPGSRRASPLERPTEWIRLRRSMAIHPRSSPTDL